MSKSDSRQAMQLPFCGGNPYKIGGKQVKGGKIGVFEHPEWGIDTGRSRGGEEMIFKKAPSEAQCRKAEREQIHEGLV